MRVRSRARALLAAVAVAVLATTAPGLASTVVPAGAQERTSAITVRGLSQTPFVSRDGTWSVELSLTGAPTDGQVRGRILDRLDDRAAYNEALFGIYDETRKASIPALEVGDLPIDAEGARTARLAVTLLAEGTSRPGWAFLSDGLRAGVYPVEVDVLDADGESVGGTLLFLTRVADAQESGGDRPPLRVATVLPVQAPLSIDAAGRPDPPAGLAAGVLAVADGLNLAPDLPATVAPRPETIEALARDPEGVDALASLRAAVQGRQVLDGTYVDAPIDEMVAAELLEELTRQRERGNSILQRDLGPPDSSTLLAAAGLTGSAAEQLWDVGVRTVVLPPGASDGVGAPTGPFAVSAGGSRTIEAVEADPGLQVALTRRRDPVLDDAGLAAELTLLASEAEGIEGVVVLPDATWPATAEALARLAAILTDPLAPVRPVTIAGLVAEVPPGASRSIRPVTPIDLGAHPTTLAEARARLSSLASLTGPGNAEVTRLDRQLLLSDDRSLSPAERGAYVGGVAATIDRRLAGVEAPPRQTITLTSSDGDIPLTLRSSFPDPVTVLIELDADSRVDFRGDTSVIQTLEPGTNRIEIPVHARVPGQSRVDVVIRTPDRAVVLDEVRYSVRSTAVSGLGLVLSVGAAAFLLLWWARHWSQTRRSNRTESGEV